MAATFSRTLRSLDADGGRGSLWWLLVAFVFLAGWLGWFCFVPVTVYAASDGARLEASQRVHAVAAPVGGRIVMTTLTLGQQVAEGEVLVELDSETEKRRLVEEQTRRAAIAPQLEALHRRLEMDHGTLGQAQLAATADLQSARARGREASTAAAFSEEEARRLGELHRRGGTSELDFLRVKADAERLRGSAEARTLDESRIERDRRVEQSRMRSSIEELHQQVALLEGNLASSASAIAVLEEEIDKRKIRAPIAGRLDEVRPDRTGSVVHEGDRLAVVVPTGTLKIVADFIPSAAVGRIHRGQSARLALDGFPWTEFGSVAATVSSVGSEPRGGHVRVELTLNPASARITGGGPDGGAGELESVRAATRVPLQHGMPGLVEVEIERAVPWRLVMRSAGRMLAGRGRPALDVVEAETRSGIAP